MRISARSSLATVWLPLLALAASCSSKPLEGSRGDGGEPDCTGLPAPAIACLVGPTNLVCSVDQAGNPTWIVVCGGTGTGGASGTSGTGGAGDGGSNPDGGAGIAAPCGSSQSCAAGLVCTTEDGVCNSPPGCGPLAACPAVCYGTCRLPSEDGGGPACTTDGDCKVEADYCTGCDCRALGAKQSLPACPGPGVACIVDPCFNKTARCASGGCVAQ